MCIPAGSQHLCNSLLWNLSKLVTSEIPIFKLGSVDEETGLSLLKTQKTGICNLFGSVLVSLPLGTIETGLQIKVCIGKLFSLFLIQNICCGYSKEPSQ